MTESCDFDGVWISKDVWLDDRLSAIEKVLFTEIDSLSGKELGCIKTNKTLAEFCQCSERTITNAIAHLKKIGLIEVESFNGRQRVLRGCLAKLARPCSKTCEAGPQNLRVVYIDSNTSSNTSSNLDICAETPQPSKTRSRKTKPFVPPTLEDVQRYIAEKHYHFDAQSFLDYYEADNWHDKNGRKVSSWKRCCVTWESTWKSRHPNYKERSSNDYSIYDPV